MEVILIILGIFIGLILMLGLPKLIRRKSIIKKHFKNIGEEIINGTRDEELMSHSKTENYTSYGLATPFGNEAARSALDEIKNKGLASADEKNGIWIMGASSVETRASEEKMLAEKIAIRCKEIGVKFLD